MRMVIVWVLTFWLVSKAQAQYPYDVKRDALWPFGYGYYLGQTDTLFGLTWLDYFNGSINVSREYADIDLAESNAVGCDTNGDLLFITNGIMIYNSSKQVMQGCDTLNPGYWAEQAPFGYMLPQGVLALPKPGSTKDWYVFHSRIGDSSHSWGGYDVQDVYYTIVDIKQNQGLGEVTSLRNVLVENDLIDYGKLTACRHANGRDWWIIFLNNTLTKYRKVLLSPNGVEDFGWNVLGTVALPYVGLGQAVFTPDGSKYLNFGALGNVKGEFFEVYNFDRCYGELSNSIVINVFDSCITGGIGISGNSRYAYTSCGLSVFQYDLEATNIEASKQLVAQWDGFVDPEFPVGTLFYLMEQTPDGRIIINSPNGVRFLHVINAPDSNGLACDVLQHDVQLYTYNGYSMPNYPNFRLGPVDGSTCDTLGIDVGIAANPKSIYIEEGVLLVYPNPVENYCSIGFGSTLKQDGMLIVHDSNGHKMFETSLQEATIGYTLKTVGWPSAIYLCTVYEGTKRKGNVRFVKD